MSLEVLAVEGMPELRPGDDLTAVIAAAAPWLRDGDVLVVTSKIVSKVEGRLRPAPSDPQEREQARQQAVDAEMVRLVASRGPTRIVETRHGFVLAAAGVDASNVRSDEIALLPVDSDASAARLRAGIKAALGVTVAVVVSDTAGRPWRVGVVDHAIGVAGLQALHNLRGVRDPMGNELQMTEVAVADEIAAAGDLVKGKLSGVPVAVLRGLSYVDDGQGVRPLIRDADQDMFRLGTAEAIAEGRRRAWGEAAATEGLHADATALLRAYEDDDLGQVSTREAILAFLAARPDAMRRSCAPGHLTASALVIDPSRDAVLLTLHPRVGAWLQLGGHCEEDDATVAAAALREAVEESGIAGLTLDPVPVHVAVHPVTCSLGVPTRHLDVRFVAVAPPGADPTISAESLDLAWFPRDRLPRPLGTDVPELARRCFARVTA